MKDPMHDHEPRFLIGLARHYLGDLVYGANDGIITTFTVVAGVSGASLSARTVLIPDGFSMGTGNVLGIRSGQDICTADGLKKTSRSRSVRGPRHSSRSF
jgi:hypothetical protein